MFPFVLIMVQRPQVDDDSGSLPHQEIPDAARTQRHRRGGERGGVASQI